ncbi:hypothetical protein GJ744_008870 [Endocarpon pusillum]|uniref:EKC/KEOPS complex subunit BUD32 n=1 Tax=Endocarpon pusillum TaxID=364733 RepID=A0A8H7AV48_9EURO|nr:hypothetical protein GJ744_008870 [Endocarpon pusillum]
MNKRSYIKTAYLAAWSSRLSAERSKSFDQFTTALRDAIEGHQSLLNKAQIIHRDISENNIIITDPETAAGFSGMLIDLDLAVVDGERTGGRHMIGTMEFMAIDMLCGAEHT